MLAPNRNFGILMIHVPFVATAYETFGEAARTKVMKVII